MRVLVLSDIHANRHALAAVRESFDLCLCLGDLVDYGLDPAYAVDWLRERNAIVIRGNHDHCVSQDIPCKADRGYRLLISATRPMMRERLGPDRLRWLAGLPITRQLRIDGKVYLLTHATPRDPLDEYVFRDPAAWCKRVAKVEADVVCVGHTHQPFVIECGGKTVLNPGSIGQPRDGDSQASYAIIEDGRIELRRVSYDLEAAIRDYEATDLDPAAKKFAIDVLRHGGTRVSEILRQPDPDEAMAKPASLPTRRSTAVPLRSAAMASSDRPPTPLDVPGESASGPDGSFRPFPRAEDARIPVSALAADAAD